MKGMGQAVSAGLCRADISHSLTSTKYWFPSIRCTQREDRMGSEDKDGTSHCYPKLPNQEDDLCCWDCTNRLLSSHQSNPVDENPRTFKPFIVPSSGGVDIICYNNQGIMIYKKKFNKRKRKTENRRAWLWLIIAVLIIQSFQLKLLNTHLLEQPHEKSCGFYLFTLTFRHDSFLLLATPLVPLYSIINSWFPERRKSWNTA